ncbi:helicase SNF2, partial [Streptococcus suis]
IDLKSEVGKFQRIIYAIEIIIDDQENTHEILKDLKDKLRLAKVEVEKVLHKEEDYQIVNAKYDVLDPLVEKESDNEEIYSDLAKFSS